MERAWIGQEWPTCEKIALRRAVTDLIEQGWPQATLTAVTRAAVRLAVRDIGASGVEAAVVREARQVSDISTKEVEQE